MVWGSLISAGSDLLGGFLGRSHQTSMFRRMYDMQKEFAQHGIQWRVEDAKKAGVHPLFALGGSTASPGAISTGSDPLAASIGRAGQHLGRAVNATLDERSRLQNKLLEAQIDGQIIDNQVRASNAALKAQVGPPAPEGYHGVYGVKPHRSGIERGWLEPVKYDEDGNHLLFTPGVGMQRIPAYAHKGEYAEELLGELGSLPHQIGLAGASGYDYFDRLVDAVLRKLRSYGAPRQAARNRTRYERR